MSSRLKGAWRWLFGYKIDPPPRGRVNEPEYAGLYEAAGRPYGWPAPGGAYRAPSGFFRLFKMTVKEPASERSSAKGEPVPKMSLRLFRGERENPFTGGKGVWVDPYHKDPETGLELLHSDQSPAKNPIGEV